MCVGCSCHLVDAAFHRRNSTDGRARRPTCGARSGEFHSATMRNVWNLTAHEVAFQSADTMRCLSLFVGARPEEDQLVEVRGAAPNI